MISKLDLIKHTDNLYDKNGFITNVACGEVVIRKINELVDAVNELQATISKMGKVEPADNSEKTNCQENVQPDYVTTSYMTDGHIKEYYGQNGASIITDDPLPEGYFITIREPETKGGDND